MRYSYSWKAGKQASFIKDAITSNCRSENDVPVVAVTRQKATPAQAGGDSLLDSLQSVPEGLIEDEDIVRTAKKKLERRAALALPCVAREEATLCQKGGRLCAFEQRRCFIESEGQLLEWHQDQIVHEGYHSPCHHGLEHAPVPKPNAMNRIPAAEAAGDEWDTLTDLPALGTNQKVRDTADAIREAQNKATLMDFCHLKHSELAHDQKY